MTNSAFIGVENIEEGYISNNNNNMGTYDCSITAALVRRPHRCPVPTLSYTVINTVHISHSAGSYTFVHSMNYVYTDFDYADSL